MSGALYVKTFVVDRSSSGAEICLRLIGPFLVLAARDGKEISGRLERLVKALARDMVMPNYFVSRSASLVGEMIPIGLSGCRNMRRRGSRADMRVKQ